MGSASVMGDTAKHDMPHCHAPIHPPAPTPTPLAHPPIPLPIIGPPVANVLIGGKAAFNMSAKTAPCTMPSCVPAGPGMMPMGSTSVTIGKGMAALRVNDLVYFASCVGPIPSPNGKVMGPGVPTVQIGG